LRHDGLPAVLFSKIDLFFSQSSILASTLQVLLLPSRPRVLVKMPFHIPLLIIQRPCPNLEQSHAHPRSHFGQLNRLETCLDKDVMSHLDRILDVLERDNAVTDLCRGFAGREEMF
jgi:hypothetical protein